MCWTSKTEFGTMKRRGGGTKGSESKLEAAVDASSADQNVTRIASPSARKDEGEETT